MTSLDPTFPDPVLALDHTATLTEDCTACGLCLESCPTYALWGTEADSPRGRIAQIATAVEEGGELTAATVGHLDACVGCLACVTACPVGVAYDRILADARPLVERTGPRSARDRALRLLLLETLPYPDRLRAILPTLAAAARLARRPRLSGRLPRSADRLARLAALVPTPATSDAASAPIPAFTAARGTRRGRVGLLLGCVQRIAHPDLHRAAIAVLTAEGFDVHAPALPDCCGGLELSAGEREHGQARAQATIAAFAGCGPLDAIVVDAPFCGTAMQDYGPLLGSDAAWGFAGQVRDICEFLADVEPVAVRGPVPVTAIYHAACQLHHGQRVGDAPQRLLRTIPELELREPAPGGHCCGGVGLYPVLEPDAAEALGQDAADRLTRTGPELIVAADPGCLTQLRRHLPGPDRAQVPELLHPVQLLGRSLAIGHARHRARTVAAHR